MAIAARIRSISFITPEPENPDCGAAEVRVDLEDGSSSVFHVVTPSHVGSAMNEAARDWSFGEPALFVKSLRREDLGRAVEKMAAHMSGFWLRYYDSRKGQVRKRKERK